MAEGFNIDEFLGDPSQQEDDQQQDNFDINSFLDEPQQANAVPGPSATSNDGEESSVIETAWDWYKDDYLGGLPGAVGEFGPNALERGGKRVEQGYNQYIAEQSTEQVQDTTRSFGDILDDQSKGKPLYGPDDLLLAGERYVSSRLFGDMRASAQQRLGRVGELAKKISEIPKSPMATEAEKNIMAAGKDGLVSALQAALADPLGTLALGSEVGAEFAPQIAAGTLATAVTKSPAAGAAFMGGLSGATERFASPNEFLSKRGYDLAKPENVLKVLADPALMEEAKSYGFTRGMIIGSFDAVSGGFASEILAKGPLKNMLAQMLTQATMGGAGEGTAQYATDGKVNWGEVVLEAVGEFSTAPIEVAGVGGQYLKEAHESRGKKAQSRKDGVILSEADKASPISDELIAQGKVALQDMGATTEATDILKRNGLSGIDTRVSVADGQGGVKLGTVKDAFVQENGALDISDDGIVVAYDDGTTLDELFSTLQMAGVKVSPFQEAEVIPAEVAPKEINETLQPEITRNSSPKPAVEEAPALKRSEEAKDDIVLLDPDSIQTDAKTFQFKAGGNENGVTEQLRGTKEWSPAAAGIAIVWEKNDGQRFIVDGHQRLGLAKQLKAEGQTPQIRAIVLREADGITAKQARLAGAVKNIQEGGESTSSLDVARVIRNGGSKSLDGVIPPRRKSYKDGKALADLGDKAFGMVVNDVVPPKYAAEVGRAIKDHDQQVAALGVIAKAGPANVNQARLMVAQVKEAGFSEGTQDSLFGEETFAETLVAERAKVLDSATKQIRSMKSLFKTALSGESVLSEAGNVLDAESNQRELTENEKLAFTVESLANRKGPVSDALNTAAKNLKSGRSIKLVRDQFLAEVRRVDGDAGRVGVGGQPVTTPDQASGSNQEVAAEEKTALPAPDKKDPFFKEKNLLRQLQNGLDDGTHPQGRPFMPEELAEIEEHIRELQSKIKGTKEPKAKPPLDEINDEGKAAIKHLIKTKAVSPKSSMGVALQQILDKGGIETEIQATNYQAALQLVRAEKRKTELDEQPQTDTIDTVDGPKEQTVIPGAEKISDKKLAERKMDQPKRSSKPQSDLDIGLFGSEKDQGDLLDAAKPKPQEPSSDSDFDDIFDTALEQEFGPKKSETLAQYQDRKNTAGTAAKSAVKETLMGLDDVTKGLSELFGGGKSINSGLSFDEETYRKAMPLFKAGVAHFSQAGSDVATMVRALVKHLASSGMDRDAIEAMRPYVKRFVSEVKSEIIELEVGEEDNKNQTSEERSDVLSGSADLERDSSDAGSKDSLREETVSDGRGNDGGRASGGRGESSRSGSGVSSGRGLSDNGTPALGEPSDSSVSEGKARTDAGSSKRSGRERSGDDRIDGPQNDRISTATVERLAENATSLSERAALQAKADKVSVVVADIDNIRETLPLLNPEQQDDVFLAETRFTTDDALPGYMFTNGTGTGKTYTGAGIVKRFIQQGKSNILIMAPSKGILNGWIDTAKDLGFTITTLEDTQDSGVGVVATTYANMRQNRHLVDREWDLIVPDESQHLMQAEDGRETGALSVFRAITNHPDNLLNKARLTNRDMADKISEIRSKIKELKEKSNSEAKIEKLQDKLSPLVKLYEEKNRALAEKFADLPRSNAAFLSATPFAYVKSIDYAEGYLFSYNEGKEKDGFRGYNKGSNTSQFFMLNFGYRMRYNKLTRPDAGVNTEVMEREFHEKLKREGALSGRALKVDADYDRKFLLVDDAVGNRIDEALKFLMEADDGKFRDLHSLIYKKFDYLSRMRLLEAIKATHAVPIIKSHMKLGRKVVVFHDYNSGRGFNPFTFPATDMVEVVTTDSEGNQVTVSLLELYVEFIDRNPDVLTLDFSKMRSPLETLTKAFPGALSYNGTVSNKERNNAKEKFNEDGSGRDLIIVQSAAGEAGISLHDTTGKHQRILMNLGMPVRPTTAIQEEGRIYRVGQVTDASFRYMNTGTSWERFTFADKIAVRAGTAENLALGDQARAIKQSFIDAFLDSDEYPAGTDDGKGGKEIDKANNASMSPFERSKTFYYAQGKKTGKRNQREGVDYYATPEPVGFKMIEFANIASNEKVLEPSVGHGAIARFLPEDANRTLIEPSSELSSRAALTSPGSKIVTSTFEDHHITNKYDAIVMNPPYGSGGKTAIEHVAKAVKHLRNGGRIVALIPEGGMATKRFEKFMDSDQSKDVYLAADISLPSVTFKRAGTSVKTHIVVLEKQTDAESVSQIQQQNRDYSNAETIEELFDRIEAAELRPRIEPITKEVDSSEIAEKGEEVAAPEGQSFTTKETVHAKNGNDLYVAVPSVRVDKDAFKQMVAVAKRHGGYYSKFRGNGAIPGYQFRSEEDRTAFIDEFNEDQGKLSLRRQSGFTSEFKNDRDKIAKALTARLKQLNLSDKIALRLLDKIDSKSEADGRYLSGIIDVALNGNNQEWTLNHEVIHALKDLGVIRSLEWKTLEAAAKADTDRMDNTKETYSALELTESELVEEAIADMFADWVAEKTKTGGAIKRTFNRVISFFKSLKAALSSAGYKTTDDIFEAIDSGRIGKNTASEPVNNEASYSLTPFQGDIKDLATDPAKIDKKADTPPHEFNNPDSEKRWQDARQGSGDRRKLHEKIGEWLTELGHGFTRHYIDLPNIARFADVKEKLRHLEAAPEASKEQVIRILKSITGNMSRNDLDLFTRKIVLEDLKWEAENDRLLPFGLNGIEDVETELKELDSILSTRPDLIAKVRERKQITNYIARSMVESGVLTKEQIKNPAYFRHQVLEYALAQERFTQSNGKKLRSPSWHGRKGSSLDINANYLEAEFDWINKALINIAQAKTIEYIKQSEHNVRKATIKAAKDHNDKHLKNIIARDMDANGYVDNKGQTTSPLNEEQKDFKRSIARGLGKVAKEIGSLDIPPWLQSAADNIKNGSSDGDVSLFPLLAWILDNDQPGSGGAAMAFKAINGRKHWAKELLGDKYADPSNIAGLVKRGFAPEGYTTWQPDEGKMLFLSKTLSENAIDKILGIVSKEGMPGLDPDTIQAVMAESTKSILTVGSDRYTMIIPEELALTLDSLGDEHASQLVDFLLEKPIKAWKIWTLINPRRVIKYNLNNISGDLDAVIAGNPRALKKLPKAIGELWSVMHGGSPTKRYREAVERGVFDGGLSVQEIPEINELKQFEHLLNPTRLSQPGKLTMKGIYKIWGFLKGYTQFRENWLRYAAYLDYVERMEAGEPMSSIGYGASKPDIVDSVEDSKDRAALLARDMVGDYGNISHWGRSIRKRMIPFYSWMEVNTKRYWRLIGNAYGQGIGKGLVTSGFIGASLGARTTVYLGLRMAMLYASVQLFNNLYAGDEEDELDDNERIRLHINLGKGDDGQIRLIRFQGAFSDFLNWVGFEDAMAALLAIEKGRASTEDVVKAVAKAPFNKIGSGLTPTIKLPFELSAGQSFWPDVFNPRPIRDNWRQTMRTFSLEHEYDWLMNKPSRGYGVSWLNAIVSSRDVGENSYNRVRGLAYEWNRDRLGTTGSGGYSTPRSAAIYDYKRAVKYDDVNAQKVAQSRIKELGVSPKDLQASIKRAHPLGPVPIKYRAEFKKSLTPKERKAVDSAINWYNSTYK